MELLGLIHYSQTHRTNMDGGRKASSLKCMATESILIYIDASSGPRMDHMPRTPETQGPGGTHLRYEDDRPFAL